MTLDLCMFLKPQHGNETKKEIPFFDFDIYREIARGALTVNNNTFARARVPHKKKAKHIQL